MSKWFKFHLTVTILSFIFCGIDMVAQNLHGEGLKSNLIAILIATIIGNVFARFLFIDEL